MSQAVYGDALTGPGCQPSASAAIASSQSGIPIADNASPRLLLLAIDQLFDQLPDRIKAVLEDGLADAFEIAERTDRSLFLPEYPTCLSDRAVWTKWRADRDAVLAGGLM